MLSNVCCEQTGRGVHGGGPTRGLSRGSPLSEGFIPNLASTTSSPPQREVAITWRTQPACAQDEVMWGAHARPMIPECHRCDDDSAMLGVGIFKNRGHCYSSGRESRRRNQVKHRCIVGAQQMRVASVRRSQSTEANRDSVRKAASDCPVSTLSRVQPPPTRRSGPIVPCETPRPPYPPQRLSSSSTALSSTFAPAVTCSGFTFSASLWLMPCSQGMKIIEVGATRAI